MNFDRFFAFLNCLLRGNAAHHGSVRMMTACLLVFQLISFCAIYAHNAHEIHVHSAVSGQTIHLTGHHDAHQMTDAEDRVHHAGDHFRENVCLALDYAMSSVMPIPAHHRHLDIVQNQVVSSDVIYRHLEAVYLSHQALAKAPKHSPPACA